MQTAYDGTAAREAQNGALEAENSALREELALWRHTGVEMAKRDADVVTLLRDKLTGATTDNPQAGGRLKNASLLEIIAADAEAHGWRAPLLLQFYVLLLCSLAVFIGSLLLYCASVKASQAKHAAAPITQEAAKAGLLSSPVFRPFSLVGGYSVEVSEMHVGGLPKTGDICVSVRGGGQEMKTKSVSEASPGGEIRFQEAFNLQLRRFDASGHVAITVVNRDAVADEILASLRLTNQEVLDRVLGGHGEYFRFELQAIRRDCTGQQLPAAPYISLRIRKATGAPLRQSPVAG